MIEFISSWAKSLGLVIVVVSILEMLLPNNKTKKYVRVVMGIYVLFSIISPFINNKEALSVDNIETYANINSNQIKTEVNQTSMNDRIQELYVNELEKDITKKVSEKGYKITECKVSAKIEDKENESKISKIRLKVEKDETKKEENKETEETFEDKVVSEVQKINPINTEIRKEENKENNKKENTNITKVDIQNIKKFLIEEYGVKENCLEIS